MDTTQLQNAHRTLLAAAATVADSGESPVPPPGEWSADQILAHVAIVNATTIATIAAVASGGHTAYDNRMAHDAWTLDRIISLAGGNAGLRDRIRLQGDALGALCGPMLSETELNTPVPTLLLSNGKVLVDQPVPLRDLISGLADVELPTHATQLLNLLPSSSAR
jgi:hypothetical protein